LRARNGSALRSTRSPPRRARIHLRRRLHDRRHGLLPMDRAAQAPATELRRLPADQALVHGDPLSPGDAARLRARRAVSASGRNHRGHAPGLVRTGAARQLRGAASHWRRCPDLAIIARSLSGETVRTIIFSGLLFAAAAAGEELNIDRIFDGGSLSGPTPTELQIAPDGSRVTFLRAKADDQDTF